ncbi:MAG TPA: PIG-L family deacetylase [Rhodothermales bacterium]
MRLISTLALALPLAFSSAPSLPPSLAPSRASEAPAADDAGTLVVMNLAAHPDDEDGRTLAYYRWARDARAYSVIYTRGEGGQNEIGPELYDELGAIRTRETERAARILGTQVFFLNFEDFGFSRTADEAFERWGGRDSVTARITYLIRKLKPDVLFTNHDTLSVGPGRQHGHHQAVGISAYDAFALAADPTYHPEQLEEEGVDLWQPKRLFLRHWNQPGGYAVAVPVGDMDASGRSYADMAGDALREHASQGMDRFGGRFDAPATYFTLLRQSEDAPPIGDTDLAAGIVPTANRPASLRYLIDSRRIDMLPEGAISLSDSVGVPGGTVRVQFDVAKLPTLPVRIRFSGAIDTALTLTPNAPSAANLRLEPDAIPNRPHARYQYERFLSSPPVAYEVLALPGGVRTHGGYLPLDVAPALVVDAPVDVIRLDDASADVPIDLTVWDAGLGDLTLRVAVVDPERRDVLGEQYDTYSFDARTSLRDTVHVRVPAALPEGEYGVMVTASASEQSQTLHHALRARSVDVRAPRGLRVGVVESYDNALSTALADLGVELVLLDSMALAEGDLDDLHTIVIDMRAYLVRPDLRAYNDRLLAWVERGGHLVVNYHKTFDWNASYAPYPIELSRARVTREDAPVRVLQPDHVLFHEPNELREGDWDGWVQERGLYFPANYDSRYTELFALNDPDEPEQRGSTLLAQYGEGTYLYTALVWYRQLKEYHPGAFRLFANMISLPATDGRVDLGLSARDD